MAEQINNNMTDSKNDPNFIKHTWKKPDAFVAVSPGFILVKRSFTGKIKAYTKNLPVTEIPKDFTEINKRICDMSDEEIDEAIEKFEKIKLYKEKDLLESEKAYRNMLRNSGVLSDSQVKLAIIDRKMIPNNYLVKLKQYIKESKKYADDASIQDIRVSYRKYSTDKIEILKKQAKTGLKMSVPFEKMITLTTEERCIDTQPVKMEETRTFEFDVDPWFTISDPVIYTKKLMTIMDRKTGEMNEKDLIDKIGERVNQALTQITRTRGIKAMESLVREIQNIMDDEDIAYDMALIGEEYGIEFKRISLKIKVDNRIIQERNKNTAQVEMMKRVKEFIAAGINPNIALMTATGKGSEGGSSIDPTTLLAMGLLSNGGFGNNNNTPQPVNGTLSGIDINQLISLGVCDAYGALSEDDYNAIITSRTAAGIPITGPINATNITSQEVMALLRSKGKIL